MLWLTYNDYIKEGRKRRTRIKQEKPKYPKHKQKNSKDKLNSQNFLYSWGGMLESTFSRAVCFFNINQLGQ
jgi:hypothetical protein